MMRSHTMHSPLPIRKLRHNCLESKQRFLADEKTLSLFAEAVEIVIRCYQEGGRLYALGTEVRLQTPNT